MKSLTRSYSKSILVLVPLYADNLTAVLSPLLGQYGIVVSDFVSRLSSVTKFLSRDIVLRVRLQLYSNGLYDIQPELVTFSLLCQSISAGENRGSGITPHAIYKVVLLYSFCTTNFNVVRIKTNYLNFRGYLNSYN